MEAHVGKLVFPGQVLYQVTDIGATGKTIIGPGLKSDDEYISVTKAGVVRKKDTSFFWVDCVEKRYVPAKGDSVLGSVISKGGDNFKIDVGSSDPPNLSYLAFEAATKRNRPDVKVGDLIFAKFSVATKHIEPELVCIDGLGRANGYGVIRAGGYAFSCSLNLARKILRPDCPLLKSLGNHIPYEISVGVNGRIWVKGRSSGQTIAVMNAILSSEHMNNKEINSMIKKMGRVFCGYGKSEEPMEEEIT